MAVVHVNVSDEVQIREEAHSAVDAGQADPMVDPASPGVNFGDLQMLVGSREDVQHCRAGAGELQSASLKRCGHTRTKHGRSPK
jgi:hypothetical protein